MQPKLVNLEVKRVTESFVLLGTVLVAVSLLSGGAPAVLLAQETARPAGWADSTHGARVQPDYERLFAMDRVHELRITIAPDRFREMQTDLETIQPAGMPGMGPGGRGGRGGRGAPPFGDPAALAELMAAGVAACEDEAPAAACTIDGMPGACTAMFGGPLMCVPETFAAFAGRGGGAPRLTSRDPIYVPVTITHDGHVWTQVGMRYKGNSSLMSANGSGNGKVPFRLNFDRYEDEFPGTRNQRFYGFDRLTFSSNFADDSQLYEVLATEILRDRGVPAARAAFYRIFVDVGAGPEYWGLYTMVEDPSDGAMLDAQFGGQGGNLYKPDGPGADWTRFEAEGFEKRTNEDEADFDDVSAAISALHASQDDPEVWRAALEETFDVDLFLRWLAVNTLIDNWDSYGVMSHNYYLYADPAADGRLKWIPWDHNMAFGAGPFGGGGGFGRGRGRRGFGRGGPLPGAGAPGVGRGAVPFALGNPDDVLHEQVGETWPLIQRLLADEVYAARYRELLGHAMEGLFEPEAFEVRARELHDLIAPSVVGERGERPTHTTISSPEAFGRSLDGPDGLIERVRRRQATAREALERVENQ